MTLSDHQWAFLRDLARLIEWAEDHGYKLTGGDLYRDPRVHGEWGERRSYAAAKSLHKRRLAVDLNLFAPRFRGDDGRWSTNPGVYSPLMNSGPHSEEVWDFEVQEGRARWQYVSASHHHAPLGEYWESLSIYNRWGGRFGDGNHYERLTTPRAEDL